LAARLLTFNIAAWWPCVHKIAGPGLFVLPVLLGALLVFEPLFVLSRGASLIPEPLVVLELLFELLPV
jgi:hypothetical protein